MTQNKITAALAVVAVVAALAGCGGSSAASAPSASKATAAPNPVEILQKITGCDLPPGTTVGDRIGGVRYASCTISDRVIGSTAGDQVTAYTSADPEELAAQLQLHGGSSTDSTKVIKGAGFFLTDSGSFDPNNGGGMSFATPPETVAEQVGGKLQ